MLLIRLFRVPEFPLNSVRSVECDITFLVPGEIFPAYLPIVLVSVAAHDGSFSISCWKRSFDFRDMTYIVSGQWDLRSTGSRQIVDRRIILLPPYQSRGFIWENWSKPGLWVLRRRWLGFWDIWYPIQLSLLLQIFPVPDSVFPLLVPYSVILLCGPELYCSIRSYSSWNNKWI